LSANRTTSVSGTISGLGSVIVNGTRYETIGASIVDADSTNAIRTPPGLGMTVTIEPSTSSASAAATIRIQSGLKGFVSAMDATTKTLNVAGLLVSTDTGTFIVTTAGTAGNFNSLQNGQFAEVHGLPQADGTFKATRIEIKLTPSASDRVQLVGVVTKLDTTNTLFSLGNGSNSVTITYAGTVVPAGLANGAVISVHTAATSNASQYAATSLYLRSTNASTYAQYSNSYAGTSGVSNEINELYGVVSGKTLTATGCTLQVQGVPTAVSSVSLCASIQDGDYVQVKGILTNGSIAAHQIEFRTAGSDRTLGGYQDDVNDADHDGLKYSRLLTSTPGSVASVSGYSPENSSTYEIYGTLSNCSASICTLTANGVAYTADMGTALWEQGMVTSGWVEAKGYTTGNATFKVIKIEAKY